MCGEVQVPEEHLDASLQIKAKVIVFNKIFIFNRFVAFAMRLDKIAAPMPTLRRARALKMPILFSMFRPDKQIVVTKVLQWPMQRIANKKPA